MSGVNQPLSDDAEIFATVAVVGFLTRSNLPGGFGESLTHLPAGTYVVRRSQTGTGAGTYEVLENRHMRATLYPYQLRELTPMEHLALTGE